MPVKRYVSANGRLLGEIAAGVRTDYLTDALGSITGTVDEGGKVINTYRYKPYGARLAKTGAGADPRFQWTGASGSRVTNLNRAEQYNVYRHYGTQQAAWTSVDRFWPTEWQFCYVEARPTYATDRLGLSVATGADCTCQICQDGKPFNVPGYNPFKFAGKAACGKITACMANPLCREKAKKCISDVWKDAPGMLHCLYNLCNSANVAAEVVCATGASWCVLRDICAFTHPNKKPCTIHVCTKPKVTDCSPCYHDGPSGNAYCWEPACKLENTALWETIIHEMSHLLRRTSKSRCRK